MASFDSFQEEAICFKYFDKVLRFHAEILIEYSSDLLSSGIFSPFSFKISM
jgi:hypothetical protein